MIEGHLIVIGAMKAGTTTLFQLLARHPDLVRGEDKELDYFNGHRWAGPEAYDALFPDVPENRPVLTLDASPAYAKYASRSPAPRRIAQLSRPVHLVYLLRDPVDRALSHVRHNINQGRVALDGLAELDLEHYAHTSRYSAQIEAYQDVGLGDRLLLLDFAELCRDPVGVVRAVCRHAGLRPFAVPRSVHANRGPLPAATAEGVDLAKLRSMMRGERRRMVRTHGFDSARGWKRLGKKTTS